MRYTARFLGDPELFIDGSKHVFPFKKAQILALMLVEEHSMSRDKICEYLWADKSVEKGKRNLSNAISYVKKVIPIDIGGNGTISLSVDFHVDRDIDKLKRIPSLSWNEISQLALPFMNSSDIENWPDFANWLMPKRQKYHAMFIEGLKKRAQKSLMSESEQNYEEALKCYECICKHEPYDEKDHGELVKLYIKTNQKIKAAETARDFAKRIETDLGINSDLSDIASLMKRKSTESNPLLKDNKGFSPLTRSAEVEKMVDFHINVAVNGLSSCAMVWGEQGIGKTAFVEEVVSGLAEKGWRSVMMSCLQDEADCSMAPFMRLLKQVRQTPFPYENITSFSELGYSYMAETIYSEIASSDSESCVFVIENIQWMDKASWIILDSIMRSHTSIMHLIVSGFEEIRSPFFLRTATVVDTFIQLEIRLKRFNLEETGRICVTVCPERGWTQEQIYEVYLQTEGNPYFIKEVLKNGIEQHKEGGTSYRNIFLSMVELLDEGNRSFLDAAALMQEPIPMLHIAKVLDISPLSVSRLYNEAHRQGFLREQCGEDGEICYYFTHTKIREALLSVMSASRRTAIHIRCVEILEAMRVGVLYRHRDICVRLFRHCHEAGLAGKELYWRLRELELHFSAAHEVFPTMVDQDLMYYTPSAEDISYTETALATAWSLFDKLMRKNGGTPELLAAERDLYILKGAYLWWSTQYDDAKQMLSDAIHKSIITGSPESAAKACIQMCYLAIQTDNGELLSQCASQLNFISRKTHMHQWLGISFRFLAISRILTGRYSEVELLLQMSTKVFEKLEEGGERYSGCIMAAEHFRGDLGLATGNIDEALAYYLNCIEIGESMGLYRGLGLSFAKASFCMMLLGDYDKAEQYLLRAEKLNIIMHSDSEKGLQGGGISFSLLGLIYCRKGDWKNGKIYFSMAEKLARSARRPTWQAIMYWAKSKLCESAADMPEDFARAVLTQRREWYEKQLRSLQHKVGWRI